MGRGSGGAGRSGATTKTNSPQVRAKSAASRLEYVASQTTDPKRKAALLQGAENVRAIANSRDTIANSLKQSKAMLKNPDLTPAQKKKLKGLIARQEKSLKRADDAIKKAEGVADNAIVGTHKAKVSASEFTGKPPSKSKSSGKGTTKAPKQAKAPKQKESAVKSKATATPKLPKTAKGAKTAIKKVESSIAKMGPGKSAKKSKLMKILALLKKIVAG